jgi:hypothetical protein
VQAFQRHTLKVKVNNMDYTELKAFFIEKGLDEQTSGRLAEAISDAGWVSTVVSILNQI